jgi:hypothetical protein
MMKASNNGTVRIPWNCSYHCRVARQCGGRRSGSQREVAALMGTFRVRVVVNGSSTNTAEAHLKASRHRHRQPRA